MSLLAMHQLTEVGHEGMEVDETLMNGHADMNYAKGMKTEVEDDWDPDEGMSDFYRNHPCARNERTFVLSKFVDLLFSFFFRCCFIYIIIMSLGIHFLVLPDLLLCIVLHSLASYMRPRIVHSRGAILSSLPFILQQSNILTRNLLLARRKINITYMWIR